MQVAAQVTSHAVFLTASTGSQGSLMPNYPTVPAWQHQAPDKCRACKVLWAVGGSNFNLVTHFSAQVSLAWRCLANVWRCLATLANVWLDLLFHRASQFGGYFDEAGANYIRSTDSVDGIGLDVRLTRGQA